jgi:hypothetical protein
MSLYGLLHFAAGVGCGVEAVLLIKFLNRKADRLVEWLWRFTGGEG